MNEQASAWLNAVEGLPAVHARMMRVAVLNRPALQVIHSQDEPDTLFYCDPPCLHQTRTARRVYGSDPFKMSERDHVELLDVLRRCRGKVMLSGYRCKLYDSALTDWARHDFELPSNAAAGSSNRRMVDSVWCNF